MAKSHKKLSLMELVVIGVVWLDAIVGWEVVEGMSVIRLLLLLAQRLFSDFFVADKLLPTFSSSKSVSMSVEVPPDDVEPMDIGFVKKKLFA